MAVTMERPCTTFKVVKYVKFSSKYTYLLVREKYTRIFSKKYVTHQNADLKLGLLNSSKSTHNIYSFSFVKYLPNDSESLQMPINPLLKSVQSPHQAGKLQCLNSSLGRHVYGQWRWSSRTNIVAKLRTRLLKGLLN